MRRMFDWLVVQLQLRDWWRYVTVECGAQCVIIIGMLEMHKWCVDNLGTMEVSCYILKPYLIHYITLPASIPLHGYPVLSNSSLFYHLESVSCKGHENMLSECGHNRLGVHNCVTKKNEAGAICRGKFCLFILRKIIYNTLQSKSVMRLIFDWLMVQQLTLEE